jgi:hypothetical protein
LLNHVDHNERDVVLLGSGSGLPVTYLGEQLIRQLRRRAKLIVADSLFKPDVAEGITIGILGLSYAVGVKQEAVAWVDRHGANGIVVALPCHSKQ